MIQYTWNSYIFSNYLQAWLVVVSSFLCNGIIFGIINSFGTVFVELEKQIKDENPGAAGMLASLVGSAAVGATFLLSPISSILTDRFGIRKTAFAGSVLASIGMLLSALCLKYAPGYEVYYQRIWEWMCEYEESYNGISCRLTKFTLLRPLRKWSFFVTQGGPNWPS